VGIYIDVATLKTMDDRQYRAGLVETVKHALIADNEFFNFLEDDIDRENRYHHGVLETIGIHCHNNQQLAFANAIENIIQNAKLCRRLFIRYWTMNRQLLSRVARRFPQKPEIQSYSHSKTHPEPYDTDKIGN
jgi:hypothetical protein